VKVTSLPNQTFTGRVVQIGAVVDRSSRVIPVNVELDNSRQLLKPEMFAGLEISMTAPQPQF
jgi:cobalt-zinc-cadmium efflux system membrane fusion protein